jgi:DNA-binding MarR family transcriptional regulator
VLLAFAIEFEVESPISLAISANVVRVLTAEGVRQRDIPNLSGVSKESISMAIGILTKQKLGLTATGADGRTKIVRLTPKGVASKAACHRLVSDVEDRWRTRFGADHVEALRHSLERFVGDATPEGSPLFRGLIPYPDGWRAAVPAPRTLPHYPMVLHRGGYPDGS